MFYLYDKDPEEWSKKHKITPGKDWKCIKCGKMFKVNIPIVMKEYVGFSTKVHECGESYTKITVTPLNPETKAIMMEALGIMGCLKEKDK